LAVFFVRERQIEALLQVMDTNLRLRFPCCHADVHNEDNDVELNVFVINLGRGIFFSVSEPRE
jgi:hypothetical protein